MSKRVPAQDAKLEARSDASAPSLAHFSALLDAIESNSEAGRRRFYARLLDEALHELACDEGSLLLAWPPEKPDRLELAGVRGLNSEAWVGERLSIDKGVVGEAARTQHPVRKTEAFGETLCVPLYGREQLQGVLSLVRPEGPAYNASESARAERIGAGLGAALWASRNLSRHENTERRLKGLTSAAEALIRGHDLKEVLDRLTQHAQALMDAEACTVFLSDEEGYLRAHVVAGGSVDSLKEIRLAPGEGVAGWCAEHGEALVISDAASDTRFASGVDKRTRFKTRNLACAPMAPISSQGRVMGVLEVVNRKGSEPFDSSQLPLLQALANLAALAVENARLYEQMQERARRLNQDLIQANVETSDARGRLESVLFAMQDAVFGADENGRVTLVNRAAQIIAFGLSAQDAQGRALGEVIDHEAFREALKEVRATGQPSQAELELSTPEPRVYAVVITPINDLEGYITGLVLVLRDVTRFKELERMKAAFLNTVSHELRTPMTSIRAFSELIAKKGADPEKTREWAGIIYEEARRLGRLIDDLLDVSRIEAGKRLSVNCRVAELKPIFTKTLALFTNYSKSHLLKLVIPEDLSQAEIDPDRIEQILANLISNAIKYSPKGGEVSIEVSFVPPDRFRVEVKDQGIGLSERDQARLFEKFYRAETNENVGIGGTGLGLSICKYLVEQHRGQIGVKSQAGQGSCFWFEMPIFSPDKGEAQV